MSNLSYFNVTDGLAGQTFTMTHANDLTSEIFAGTKVLGMEFLISLILVFICIVFITRNTGKWLDISAPMIITWSIIGLNIPIYLSVPIALVWVINQIGVKTASKVLNAVSEVPTKVIHSIKPSLIPLGAKSRITEKKYKKAQQLERLNKQKLFIDDAKKLKGTEFKSVGELRNEKYLEKQRKKFIEEQLRKKINIEKETLMGKQLLKDNYRTGLLNAGLTKEQIKKLIEEKKKRKKDD